MSTSKPFIFISGPCVIESEQHTLDVAGALRDITAKLPVQFIFKASYDKANRTSASSYRGPGIEEGLRILARVKHDLGVPVLSDIHGLEQVTPAAAVLDVLQIPAFLARQTDLVAAAARTGRCINIKKAQFMAPQDMRYVAEKAAATGNTNLMLTERGATFGYNNLVVDFRSFSILAEFGYPVIFDATHAVQIPSLGGKSSGNREYVAPLARAAAAYGIDGLFAEAHPDPDNALSDGPNSLRLDSVEGLLHDLLRIRAALQP